MRITSWIKFRWAHLKWWLDYPRLGDPLHGKGESRRQLRAMLVSRWIEREPKRKDYEA